MLAQLAFAALATLTSAQQADLVCVGVARTVALAVNKRPVQADDLDRMSFAAPSLERLRNQDPKRDWIAEAPDFSADTYATFMTRLNVCQRANLAPAAKPD